MTRKEPFTSNAGGPDIEQFSKLLWIWRCMLAKRVDDQTPLQWHLPISSNFHLVAPVVSLPRSKPTLGRCKQEQWTPGARWSGSSAPGRCTSNLPRGRSGNVRNEHACFFGLKYSATNRALCPLGKFETLPGQGANGCCAAECQRKLCLLGGPRADPQVLSFEEAGVEQLNDIPCGCFWIRSLNHCCWSCCSASGSPTFA